MGQEHNQEHAQGEALDRAEGIRLSGTLETPAGSFRDFLVVEETTPLERGEHERKSCTAGVGLLQDEGLLLTRHGSTSR